MSYRHHPGEGSQYPAGGTISTYPVGRADPRPEYSGPEVVQHPDYEVSTTLWRHWKTLMAWPKYLIALYFLAISVIGFVAACGAGTSFNPSAWGHYTFGFTLGLGLLYLLIWVFVLRERGTTASALIGRVENLGNLLALSVVLTIVVNILLGFQAFQNVTTVTSAAGAVTPQLRIGNLTFYQRSMLVLIAPMVTTAIVFMDYLLERMKLAYQVPK